MTNVMVMWIKKYGSQAHRHNWFAHDIVYSYFMPVCSMDDLMHYCTRPKAECNSASGRPRYRGVIV